LYPPEKLPGDQLPFVEKRESELSVISSATSEPPAWVHFMASAITTWDKDGWGKDNTRQTEKTKRLRFNENFEHIREYGFLTTRYNQQFFWVDE
jgi:hypothetical protein